MKRTSLKDKPELKRRLQLVRTTIRELTPAQLAQAGGGGELEYAPTANCSQCSYTYIST
jgi:hypothetical protein